MPDHPGLRPPLLERRGQSSLVPLIVGGGLVIGAVLLISLALMFAGFLTAPFLLVAVVVIASIGILGVSIGAAVLSRRQ